MLVDSFPSLFWGYSVIWMLFVVYLTYLANKIAKIEKKLAEDKNDSCKEC